MLYGLLAIQKCSISVIQLQANHYSPSLPILHWARTTTAFLDSFKVAFIAKWNEYLNILNLLRDIAILLLHPPSAGKGQGSFFMNCTQLHFIYLPCEFPKSLGGIPHQENLKEKKNLICT